MAILALRNFLACFLAIIKLVPYCVGKRFQSRLDQIEILPLYSHNISPKKFESLIKWLTKHDFEFISTGELIEILDSKKNVRKKVWISLDDGWAQNFHLLPIIERLRVPITIFLSTNCILEGYFWFSIVYKLRRLIKYDHPHKFWEIPETERQMSFINLLPNIVLSERETLTVEEINKLASCEYLTFGNHTHNHVILNNCSPIQIYEEITLADSLINRWISSQPIAFAYPNGNVESYSRTVISALGYRLIATTNRDYIYCSNTETNSVPRIHLPNNCSLPEMICRVLMIW